jgi:gamma-glutamyltranspeptidase/glutathione hydrolase
LPFDSHVKQWAFWKANDVASASELEIPMVELLASNGIPKDTTHISVIDKDGNMFDSTPSGGWIGGAE